MEEEYREIQSLELELASPETRRNLARLSERLANDFEEFGSSGKVFKKQDILDSLPEQKSNL